MNKVVINSKFTLGDTVYVKVDVDQMPKMIVGFVVDFNGLKYILKDHIGEGEYFENELSTERNVITISHN